MYKIISFKGYGPNEIDSSVTQFLNKNKNIEVISIATTLYAGWVVLTMIYKEAS
jgi:hypothetical protein